MTLTFYHQTTEDDARVILDSGFRDHTGTYMTGHEFTGVWLSDRPLDANEGAKGKALLQVTIDALESDLGHYEWIEEDKPYREWLMPSALINTCMIVKVVDDDDLTHGL